MPRTVRQPHQLGVIPSAYKLQSQKPPTPREESRPIPTIARRAAGAQTPPCLIAKTSPEISRLTRVEKESARPSFTGPRALFFKILCRGSTSEPAHSSRLFFFRKLIRIGVPIKLYALRNWFSR